MNRVRFHRGWILLVAWGWLAVNARAAIPSVERLLPEDTLMMVTTPDFAKLREVWKTAPQARLLNDPAMKPFVDKFIERLTEELVEPLERELGVSLDDFTQLPQGQVTLARTQNDRSPATLLLVDTR